MNSVKNATLKNGHEYILIDKQPEYLRGTELPIKIQSDVIRLHLLSDMSDAMWLDSDCEVSDELFTFKYLKDKPYIFGALCGACAMFNNGYTDLFRRILVNHKIHKNSGCVCMQYLNEHKDQFNVFPKGLIKHYHRNTIEV